MRESQIREVIAREAVAAGIDPETAVAEILPRAVVGALEDGTTDAFVFDRGVALPVKDAVAALATPPPPTPKTAEERTVEYINSRRQQRVTPSSPIEGLAPHKMSAEEYRQWRKQQRQS